MNTAVRLIINFLVSGIILLFFRHFGWITFTDVPGIVGDPALNDILVAGVIAFIVFVIGELAGLAFGAFAFLTCGIGCLLYPVFAILLGYIKLIGAQIILPNWFTFDAVWWKVTIISIAVGMFRIPSFRERKKIVIREREGD